MNSLLDIHTHGKGFGIHNCSPEEFEGSLRGYYSLGIHPWYINKYKGKLPLKELFAFAKDLKVLAIGESGLDKLCGVPMSEQIEVFKKHISLSENLNKPLIIHQVKCIDELLLLHKQLKPHSPWVIHGFRGKPAQVQQFVSHGFYLSFGELFNPQSLMLTPVERMFIETDESLLPIEDILQKVATCKDVDKNELKSQIEKNVQQIFISCSKEH